jgi:hypothetical protein
MSHKVERTLLSNLAKLLIRDAAERAVVRVGCGIADEDVDPAPAVPRLLYQRFKGGLI